jgi:hypothetical protein
MILIKFSTSSVHGKIEEGKKNIEKELKDHVKLYSWEQAPYSSASIENFKRTRQNIFKLLFSLLSKYFLSLCNSSVHLFLLLCLLLDVFMISNALATKLLFLL